MSKSIQPSLPPWAEITPLQAHCLKQVCDNLLSFSEHLPALSLSLTDMTECFVRHNPSRAEEAVSYAGQVHFLIATLANTEDLLSFGHAYFRHIARHLEEKEGASC